MPIATIASATISSPDFSGLGQIVINNLQLTQTGFTLGTLTLTSGQSPAAIGTFLSFSAASPLTFNNFSFVYGSTPECYWCLRGCDGERCRSFPGRQVSLDVKLGNLSGTYTFDAPGFLTFSNVNITIPIGQAVTIQLTGVSLTPDAANGVIASGSATITANLFSGTALTTSITGFQLMKTGFSFNASLSANNVKIGDVLSFSSVSLVASGPNNTGNFTVDTSSNQVVSGSITLMLGTVSLFPAGGVVTSSLSTVSASYDLATATSEW